MGTFSIWHWLIVLAVILLLFGGRGKISQLMADFGKGLKAFKKSVRDEEPAEDKPSVVEEAKALASDTTRMAEANREQDRVARP
jgi:sec-independent protein translocase protein TatA